MRRIKSLAELQKSTAKAALRHTPPAGVLTTNQKLAALEARFTPAVLNQIYAAELKSIQQAADIRV